MQVDFYILEKASNMKSLHFIAELCEKYLAAEQQVYIHTASHEEAERIDHALWTYRDDSFLPHNIYQSTDDLPPKIQIGFSDKPAHHHDVLINFTPTIPSFYSQFKSVIEIVFNDPNVQQLARERFRQYREQGYELKTHKISI